MAPDLILVAFRAHIDLTCRGQRAAAGELTFLPEDVPTVRMLVAGNAIERAPEFDDLAPDVRGE